MSGLCRRKCSQVHGPAIWALYRVNQIHVYISYRRAVCMRRCSPHCCRDWQGTPGSLLLPRLHSGYRYLQQIGTLLVCHTMPDRQARAHNASQPGPSAVLRFVRCSMSAQYNTAQQGQNGVLHGNGRYPGGVHVSIAWEKLTADMVDGRGAYHFHWQGHCCTAGKHLSGPALDIEELLQAAD